MLVWCRVSVADGGTELDQHWVNVFCFRGVDRPHCVSYIAGCKGIKTVVQLIEPEDDLVAVDIKTRFYHIKIHNFYLVGRICNIKCFVRAHPDKNMKICSIGLRTKLNSKLPGTTKSLFFPPKSWKFKMAAMKYIFVSRIAENVLISMILVSKHMILRSRRPTSKLINIFRYYTHTKKK